MATVEQESADGVLFTFGQDREHLRVTADAILGHDGSVFLKAPVAPGTSWVGAGDVHVRVDAVGVSLTVPAGTYGSCARLLSETDQAPGSKLTTVLCEGVGIALLELTTTHGTSRIALESAVRRPLSGESRVLPALPAASSQPAQPGGDLE